MESKEKKQLAAETAEYELCNNYLYCENEKFIGDTPAAFEAPEYFDAYCDFNDNQSDRSVLKTSDQMFDNGYSRGELLNLINQIPEYC